jgi:hypothetical protein
MYKSVIMAHSIMNHKILPAELIYMMNKQLYFCGIIGVGLIITYLYLIKIAI